MRTYLANKTKELRRYSFEYLDSSYPNLSHRMRYMKNVSLGMGEPELRLINRFIRPNAVVVDVGAHRGVYTQVFARTAKIVHAFEPVPRLGAYLRKVMPPNVTVHSIALSDRVGTAKLRIPYGGGYFGLGQGTIEPSNDLNGRQPAEIVIDTDTLDNFIDGKIDFIKIDVEGHEESVLRGGLNHIRQDKPIIMAEIEARYNPDALSNIVAMLEMIGYKGYFLQSNILHSMDTYSVERHQDLRKLGTPEYINNIIFSTAPAMI